MWVIVNVNGCESDWMWVGVMWIKLGVRYYVDIGQTQSVWVKRNVGQHGFGSEDIDQNGFNSSGYGPRVDVDVSSHLGHRVGGGHLTMYH